MRPGCPHELMNIATEMFKPRIWGLPVEKKRRVKVFEVSAARGRRRRGEGGGTRRRYADMKAG